MKPRIFLRKCHLVIIVLNIYCQKCTTLSPKKGHPTSELTWEGWPSTTDNSTLLPPIPCWDNDSLRSWRGRCPKRGLHPSVSTARPTPVRKTRRIMTFVFRKCESATCLLPSGKRSHPRLLRGSKHRTSRMWRTNCSRQTKRYVFWARSSNSAKRRSYWLSVKNASWRSSEGSKPSSRPWRQISTGEWNSSISKK